LILMRGGCSRRLRSSDVNSDATPRQGTFCGAGRFLEPGTARHKVFWGGVRKTGEREELATHSDARDLGSVFAVWG
jgi:hypothetical protein